MQCRACIYLLVQRATYLLPCCCLLVCFFTFIVHYDPLSLQEVQSKFCINTNIIYFIFSIKIIFFKVLTGIIIYLLLRTAVLWEQSFARRQTRCKHHALDQIEITHFLVAATFELSVQKAGRHTVALD